jgi:hypothetical protein
MLNGALGFLAFWLAASGICLLLPERLTERLSYPIESIYARHAIAAACLALAAGISIELIHYFSDIHPSIAIIGVILPLLWAINTFTYSQRSRFMLAEAIILIIVAIIVAIGYFCAI